MEKGRQDLAGRVQEGKVLAETSEPSKPPLPGLLKTRVIKLSPEKVALPGKLKPFHASTMTRTGLHSETV